MRFPILPAALLLLFHHGAAFAQQANTLKQPALYVADDGHVLSLAVDDHIDRICEAVEHKADVQMAVVTVQNTPGTPLGTYAHLLLSRWQVGARDHGRGVLLLVAVDDRKWAIVTTPAAAGLLPQKNADAIGAAMQVDLRVSKNDEGLVLGTQEVAKAIAAATGAKLHVRMFDLDHHPPRLRLLGKREAVVTAGMLLLLLTVLLRTGLLLHLLRRLRRPGAHAR